GAVPVFSTLIEHYDGNSWSVVTSPNTTEGQDNELFAVRCTSATDCWAVGYYSVGNPALPIGTLVYQTLIVHWDGNAWSLVDSPNSSAVESNVLNDVACAAPDNCWAVGGFHGTSGPSLTLIEHYDG